ncbi:MAG TPA: class I SAM-dependent methyltransferase [Acidimicrobiales bacterium]|nr:class I SAM-dependent methyltransferase [Acidimicrobiales bacterium]
MTLLGNALRPSHPRRPTDESGTVPGVELPPAVAAAQARAERLGFELSSEPEVGRLLAFFASRVPKGGRMLELGTGAGVGLAWIVHGIGDRHDVEVVSVEIDGEQAAHTRAAGWPGWVSILEGDGADLVGTLGSFDLIFPDAPGGKIFKLRKTIAALRPGGVILVDDMDLSRHSDPDLRSGLASVRERLFEHPDLVCAELPFASGVILASRRSP